MPKSELGAACRRFTSVDCAIRLRGSSHLTPLRPYHIIHKRRASYLFRLIFFMSAERDLFMSLAETATLRLVVGKNSNHAPCARCFLRATSADVYLSCVMWTSTAYERIAIGNMSQALNVVRHQSFGFRNNRRRLVRAIGA